MIDYRKIITATLTGTSVMTAFSYVMSHVSREQFKEPEVLASLIKRLTSAHRVAAGAGGWLLHYHAGLLFCVAYDRIWRKTKLSPTPGSALLLGGISGVIGIMVWKKALALHPCPPALNRRAYFTQLLPAHVVFGVFSMLGYRLAEPKRINK